MEGRQRISCSVRLSAGTENLAYRRYHSVDEAVSWTTETSDKLSATLDPELAVRVCQVIGIRIVATVVEDGFSQDFTIVDGPMLDLRQATDAGMKKFDEFVASEFHAIAQRSIRNARVRKLILQTATCVGIALLVSIGYWAIKILPPVFDTDAIGAHLLSSPPPLLAGPWRISSLPDGCESGRLVFQRGRYEVSVAGTNRTFHAKYTSVNATTARVEYLDSGILIEQTFRYSADSRHLMLAGIETADPDVRAAAKRLLGTRFVRCEQ
jgi:hypothetical protein